MTYNNKVLVVAPHADDEVLGCGGTLLRHISQGDSVFWLLVTGMKTEFGFSAEQVSRRTKEIEKVSNLFGFEKRFELELPPAALETLPKGEIIGKISKVISEVEPTTIYVPYRNDAHSDHEVVYDATLACSKVFRYPFVKKIMAYETLSETEFGHKPEDPGFRPNIWVDISSFYQKKCEILQVYSSELSQFPFPRSLEAIEALSKFRAIQAGVQRAESFVLLKEII